MLKKKRNISLDLFFLVSAIVVIAFVSIILPFNETITSYTVASCVDIDADGYYDEACTAADLGCDETAYVTGSNNQQNVDTNGDVLVYKDDVNGNWDIFLYDISSEATTQISTSIGEDMNPVISSQYIVWQNLSDGQWVIDIYNLATGTVKKLTSSAITAHQVTPDISSSWIVWADARNGDYDIYGYDFSQGQALVTGTGDQANPRVAGDFLAYTSDESGSLDVFLYQFSTGGTMPLTSSSAKENAPVTDGKYVVWQTDESGNVDLHGYDIVTGETIIVSDATGDQRHPEIDDGLVAWMDDRSGSYDIYVYDFASGETTQLTDGSGNEILPIVSSGDIYWIDDNSGNGDIYGASFSSSCALIGDCADDDETVYPGASDVCGDGLDNDCNLEVDDGCEEKTTNVTTTTENATTSCLQEGTTYHYWVDSVSYALINSVGDGDSPYMLGYGDGTCATTSITFYVYSVTYDGTAYYTGELVDTVSGTLDNYPEEGLDEGYGLWTATWSGEDTYYYFISVVGTSAEASDTLMVCEDAASCSGTSVTVADVADYVVLYTGEATAGTEENIPEDCEWDCSNVEWSNCEDGISTKDLEECQVTPEDETCWLEENLPESEKECITEEAVVEGAAEEKTTEETDGEEVPVFTWLNLFFTFLILVGYYVYKGRKLH